MRRSRRCRRAARSSNGQGEYVAFKVPGRQVGLLAWDGRRHATAPNAKERLLKVEYIFAPYRPGQALLTGGEHRLHR